MAYRNSRSRCTYSSTSVGTLKMVSSPSMCEQRPRISFLTATVFCDGGVRRVLGGGPSTNFKILTDVGDGA